MGEVGPGKDRLSKLGKDRKAGERQRSLQPSNKLIQFPIYGTSHLYSFVGSPICQPSFQETYVDHLGLLKDVFLSAMKRETAVP